MQHAPPRHHHNHHRRRHRRQRHPIASLRPLAQEPGREAEGEHAAATYEIE